MSNANESISCSLRVLVNLTCSEQLAFSTRLENWQARSSLRDSRKEGLGSIDT